MTAPYEPGPRDSETSTGPVRSREFWLYDGSVVLLVENTLFKVHQTILANHSEVFADLFKLPQPSEDSGLVEGKDYIDGSNVVHLHDNADDFLDLIKAIYHPSHFDDLSPTADLDTLLTFVGGILRLSTKYFIRELRKRCVTILTNRFPTTFQDYLTRSSPPSSSYLTQTPLAFTPTPLSTSISLSSINPQTPVSMTGAAPSASIPPSPRKDRTKHKPSSIMRAILLAQETNVPLILPYAYYLIARTTPSRLLSHSLTSISWHQKTICLVGREHLRLAEMSLTHAFLLAFQPSLRCLSPILCANARGPHAEWHVLEGAGRGPNPLRMYDRWDRMNVCSECLRDSRIAHERGREEVWDRLPELFELESWAELKATQER